MLSTEEPKNLALTTAGVYASRSCSVVSAGLSSSRLGFLRGHAELAHGVDEAF